MHSKKRLQQARENEVRTEMLHFTVGQFNSDAFDTFTTSGFQRITDVVNVSNASLLNCPTVK